MTINSIAYLSNTGAISGGGEKSLLDLLAGLDRDKFKPLLICPEEGGVAAAARKLGVAVEIVGMKSLRFPNPFSFFRSVRRLAEIFRGCGIAMVHANGSRCAVYGAAACRVTKLPLIWHVRILESDGLLDRFLAASSSRVIVNSNAVKGRFGWMRDKSKLEVIHNGIDLGEFYPSGRSEKIWKEFGFGPEAKVVATIGRLDWYKAHEYFIRAAGIVKTAVPEARFLIVGDGARRRFLENLAAELGLEGCLRLTGDRPDIAEILNGIDLFALSSVSEGFGRVVVEAMACGKPVVATRIGGIVEIVEDGTTGILVPPRDPEAMARAIMELLRNSRKAMGMGAAGRGRAEKMFGIDRNVKKTEALYEKLLT